MTNRIVCETPGCFREIKSGGEGDPEICSVCLACLKMHEAGGSPSTMYSIGSDRWAGLSKLIEEAGEVIQVCGKILGTNGEAKHWEGSDLRERLEEEIADLFAAVIFVMTHCDLDASRIALMIGLKVERFERWHKEPHDRSEARRKAAVTG